MSDHGPCECGIDYVRGHPGDEALHAELHDEYARGPRMPSIASLPATPVAGASEYRLVWINSELPMSLRSQAARIAYVECRELNRPVCYDGSETHERPRLLIAMQGNRAVGMVMIADGEVHWRLRWRSGEVEALERDRIVASNPAIGRVWIAADHRGRGLASAMIAHAAERTGVRPCDFVWTIPLTVGGERLVRSLCPDTWLGDGDWDDLLELLDERS